MAERIQTDIETMTRKLELEKRRLDRLEREMAVAQRTYDGKTGRSVGGGGGSRPGTGAGRPPSRQRETSDTRFSMAMPSPKNGASGATPQSPAQNRGSVSSPSSPIAALTSHTAAAASAMAAIEEAESARRAAKSGPAYKLLVHRLDIAVKKLDGVRRENTVLQQEIDRLRRARLQLDGIFERLKIEIRQRSAQLSDVNEETITGLTVQNDAKLRVSVMKRQRESERVAFKEKVMKIRSDLKACSAEHKEVEVKLKRAKEGVQKKRGLIMPAEEHDFCETAMMRRIMKTAFLNCIQRRHIKQHEKTIALFEQAFTNIKQSTGISTIEEIVKIFVALESRNYSLLTYVNHMNTEIEALEALRSQHHASDKRREAHDAKEERHREHTLGAMQKQLQAKLRAIGEAREARDRQHQVLVDLSPLLQQLCRRIQEDLERIRNAGGPVLGSELPPLPAEIRHEEIPTWLSWMEKALGRFRDLIPSRDQHEPFPPTARARVLQLGPKRLQTTPAPLVRAQELPCAASFIVDDLPSQKRNTVSAAQKAELLDEEAEEEDFDVRVLPLKDLKQRAEKAASRRRKRTRHHNGDPSSAGDMFTSTGGGGRDDPGAAPDMGRPGSNPGGGATAAEAAAAARSPPSRTGTTEGGLDVAAAASGGERTPAAAAGDADMAAMTSTSSTARRARLAAQTGDPVSDEALSAAFLRRYSMSKDDLFAMADRMGIQLSNLCYLKQEFDAFDSDQSGYIDVGELKGLLKKLGDDLTEEDLESAFQDLDADGSGEIEFFEFAEWFTSSD